MMEQFSTGKPAEESRRIIELLKQNHQVMSEAVDKAQHALEILKSLHTGGTNGNDSRTNPKTSSPQCSDSNQRPINSDNAQFPLPESSEDNLHCILVLRGNKALRPKDRVESGKLCYLPRWLGFLFQHKR